MTRFRFADVVLDLDRFEVTRHGQRVALEPKAIDVLRYLVERPGRLVTRDELLDAVWPGVAVTPNALTRVVAQLRRELGDDAAESRLIETVPTRGYRFIAAVDSAPGGAPAAPYHPPPAASVAAAAATPVQPGPAPAMSAGADHQHRRWLTLAAMLAVVIAVLMWRTWPQAHAGDGGGGAAASSEPRDVMVEKVEGESGSIHTAAFSPDGRWLALTSDRSGDFEIYLRDLRQVRSVPLTADGMRNLHPAWSPDSTAIAYHSALRHGVWVVPVAGGPARQVSSFGSDPAWSPDGKWIAFQSDEWVDEIAQPGSRLWMVPAGGGEPRPLTAAGTPPGGHGRPRWSPDGTAVYFSSARNILFETWSVRVADGLLTRRSGDTGLILHQIVAGADGPVALGTGPWPEGRRIARVPVGDGHAGTSPAQTVLGPLGRRIRSFSLAPDGRQMAIVQLESSGSVWTMPITAAGAPAGPPRRLAAGNHPAISPDGARIAYDTGTEVHVMRLDGSGDRLVLGGARTNQYPTWIDDRRLAALRRSALSTFLVEVDVETGAMRERVALPEAAAFPRMAPDGDTFVATIGEPLNRLGRGSLSSGRFDIWPPFAGYSFPVWSPDGRFLALERKAGRDMVMEIGEVATGRVRPLSPPEGQHWPGGFSPDGSLLAVAALGPTQVWNIEVVEVATGTRRPLTGSRSAEVVPRYPSWSPRGDLVAYFQSEITGSLWIARLPGGPVSTAPAR